MLNSVIEFIKSAITEQIVDDPVWATTALVGQDDLSSNGSPANTKKSPMYRLLSGLYHWPAA